MQRSDSLSFCLQVVVYSLLFELVFYSHNDVMTPAWACYESCGLVEEVEVVFVAVPTGGIGTCNAYESEACTLV